MIALYILIICAVILLMGYKRLHRSPGPMFPRESQPINESEARRRATVILQQYCDFRKISITSFIEPEIQQIEYMGLPAWSFNYRGNDENLLLLISVDLYGGTDIIWE